MACTWPDFGLDAGCLLCEWGALSDSLHRSHPELHQRSAVKGRSSSYAPVLCECSFSCNDRDRGLANPAYAPDCLWRDDTLWVLYCLAVGLARTQLPSSSFFLPTWIDK